MLSFVETKLFTRLVGDYLYAKVGEGLIWMLTIYAKTDAESISASVLRKIREEFHD